MARPRTAFITRRFGSRFGGAEAYAENMLCRLKNDFDVHVLCQEWDSEIDLPRTIIPSLNSGPNWLQLAAFAWKCSRYVHKFDLVHSHENCLPGHIHGVHVMPVRYSRYVHQRGLGRWIATATSPRWWAYLAMEKTRYSRRNGHALVAASTLIQKQIKAVYRNTNSITVIPPGVSIPESIADRSIVREKLSLHRDRIYVLLVANSPIRKGYRTLLRALPILPRDVHLLVVGGTEEVVVQAEELAREAKVSDRVKIWPSQKGLADFYSAADVCAFPTKGDAFGMVPLEAMAYGLPAIVSHQKFCGLAEFLQDGENALILDDPEDEVALASEVVRLIEDAGLRKKLERAGK